MPVKSFSTSRFYLILNLLGKDTSWPTLRFLYEEISFKAELYFKNSVHKSFLFFFYDLFDLTAYSCDLVKVDLCTCGISSAVVVLVVFLCFNLLILGSDYSFLFREIISPLSFSKFNIESFCCSVFAFCFSIFIFRLLQLSIELWFFTINELLNQLLILML